jgi:hypothetical protein
MICYPCTQQDHSQCANGDGYVGTWCDCQHRANAIHRNSDVNRDRSQAIAKIAEGFEIPKWILGNPKAEEEATKESKA